MAANSKKTSARLPMNSGGSKKKSPAKKSKSGKTLTGERVSIDIDRDSSMNVRKIENGFLISESGTKGKGDKREWYNKEYFSPTNPVKVVVPSKSTVKFGSKRK